jgi:type VI secretion system protein ImpF
MAMRHDRRLVGSVLDRLIEDVTEAAAPVREGDDLTQLLQNVRRDLEHLLNTRRRCVACPPAYRDLHRSLLEYGIPDFTGLNLSLPTEREQTRLAIERAIRQFEPRLKDVVVSVLATDDRADRRLRLRITGVLRIQPLPERVEFDSEVDPSTAAVGITPVL